MLRHKEAEQIPFLSGKVFGVFPVFRFSSTSFEADCRAPLKDKHRLANVYQAQKLDNDEISLFGQVRLTAF